MTTNSPIVLKGIEEKDAIVCMQQSTDSVIPTENLLIDSNKKGFGDDIGSITNKITSMFTVQAQFNKDSKEYKELENRIMWGQHYQQMAIDKIKGIVGSPMPNEWYSYHANKNKNDDTPEEKARKKFNRKILADKKPYFMSYIYPYAMREYRTYENKMNRNALIIFGLDIEELQNKEDKTKKEKDFLGYYKSRIPLNMYPSLMNKICFKIEDEMDSILKKVTSNFDYTILKNQDIDYKKVDYGRIKTLHNQYKKKTQSYMIGKNSGGIVYDDTLTASENRKMFVDEFTMKARAICSNEYELCNIVLDLCYTNNKSKQFAWDVCGETIIKNLLRKNNYKIKYPIKDEEGDLYFRGTRFSMVEMPINEEELNEDIIRREV